MSAFLRVIRPDDPPSAYQGPEDGFAFARFPVQLLAEMPGREVKVLLAMISFTRPGKATIDETDDQIMAVAGMCRATFHRGLAPLVAKGIVSREGEGPARRLTVNLSFRGAPNRLTSETVGGPESASELRPLRRNGEALPSQVGGASASRARRTIEREREDPKIRPASSAKARRGAPPTPPGKVRTDFREPRRSDLLTPDQLAAAEAVAAAAGDSMPGDVARLSIVMHRRAAAKLGRPTGADPGPAPIGSILDRVLDPAARRAIEASKARIAAEAEKGRPSGRSPNVPDGRRLTDAADSPNPLI